MRCVKINISVGSTEKLFGAYKEKASERMHESINPI